MRYRLLTVWTCTVSMMLLSMTMNVQAQKRESVTVRDRIPRISLKRAVQELKAMSEDDFALAMTDNHFVVFARITHATRPLSDLSRSVLSLWTRAVQSQQRLTFSHDEIEVAIGEQRYWCPANMNHIGDLVRATRANEGVFLYVMALGLREDTPVFYTVNFGSIEEYGTHEDVLEDLLEGAERLTDPEESLALIYEMQRRWSGEDWWKQEETQRIVHFVKGEALLAKGDLKAAEPHLSKVRGYIAEHPWDDFTQTMLSVLTRVSFRRELTSLACDYAMQIESPEDETEEAFCNSCVRTILHPDDLGKPLKDLTVMNDPSSVEIIDRGPNHASYAMNGFQITLTADPASGIVQEKRITVRVANEDVMDWMESAVEDTIEDYVEKLEQGAESEGRDVSTAPSKFSMSRSETEAGEILEVLIR
ncbi:hypothetical protein KQI65_07405 [bacterium]|nr:hypothetical protein [bacterium]